MDLRQNRLTAEEWDSLEIPVSKDEKKILHLIQNGYEDVNISYNDTLSIINYVKIKSIDLELYHAYFYKKYFQKIIEALFESYNCSRKKGKPKKTKKKLKKADQIRISNSDKKIGKMKNNIFEFILLDIVKKFFEGDSGKKSYYYYTLSQLSQYKIVNINIYILEDIQHILTTFGAKINKSKLIKNAFDFIERNHILRKYRDIHLYTHQKNLFTFCKKEGPKLVLYQAPTGTGKNSKSYWIS